MGQSCPIGSFLLHQSIRTIKIMESSNSLGQKSCLSPTDNRELQNLSLNCVPKCNIYTSFKSLQCWWFNQFPVLPKLIGYQDHLGKKGKNQKALWKYCEQRLGLSEGDFSEWREVYQWDKRGMERWAERWLPSLFHYYLGLLSSRGQGENSEWWICLPPTPNVTFTAAYPGLAGHFSLSRGSSSGVLELAWKCFGRSCMARTGARAGLLYHPAGHSCWSKHVVCMFQMDTKMFSSLPQLPCQLSCYNFLITTKCQRLGAGFAVIPSPARKDQTGSRPKRCDSAFLFRKGCDST